MPEQWEGNPFTEGSQDAAQKTIAVTMMVAQGVKHMRKVKEQQEALADAKTAEDRELWRRHLRAEHEERRREWEQVHENASDPTRPLYRTSAQGLHPADRMQIRGGEEFRLWTGAQPFVDTDPEARRVAETAQRRLQYHQPLLMEDYERQQAAGLTPADALAHAGQSHANWQVQTELVQTGPDMSSAARAAQTIAGDERQEAMTIGGQADDPTTPNIDERTDGLARSGDMREHSVVQGSKAKTLAAQAQPYTIQTRLAATNGNVRLPFHQPPAGPVRERENVPARRR